MLCALSDSCVNTWQLRHVKFPELWELKRFQTANVTLTLTQDHSHSYHMIGYT